MNKTEEKNTVNNFFHFLLIQNCNLLMSKLQEKPSGLKREHPELQNMKFVNFFLCLWVISALLKPDPDTDPGIPVPLNPDTDPVRIHSTAYRDTFFIYVYSVEDGNERAAGERASVEEEDNTPMEVDLEEEEDLLSRGTESTVNKRTGVVTDR